MIDTMNFLHSVLYWKPFYSKKRKGGSWCPLNFGTRVLVVTHLNAGYGSNVAIKKWVVKGKCHHYFNINMKAKSQEASYWQIHIDSQYRMRCCLNIWTLTSLTEPKYQDNFQSYIVSLLFHRIWQFFVQKIMKPYSSKLEGPF